MWGHLSENRIIYREQTELQVWLTIFSTVIGYGQQLAKLAEKGGKMLVTGHWSEHMLQLWTKFKVVNIEIGNLLNLLNDVTVDQTFHFQAELSSLFNLF